MRFLIKDSNSHKTKLTIKLSRFRLKMKCTIRLFFISESKFEYLCIVNNAKYDNHKSKRRRQNLCETSD
jgi:hypothetical protein